MNPFEVAITGAGIVAPHGYELCMAAEAGVMRGTDDDALKAHIARRGIRYKDRATRLALAASKRAMQSSGRCADGYQDLDDHRCAVVAASCFGNVDTVLRCARQIRDEGSMALSPMDLPNASANVMPATLAIWFGLRGPNLLVANGPDSGNDALFLACNLIAAGRVDRVLVCGAEAAQEAIEPLFDVDGLEQGRPIDVAAAVVLERLRPEADVRCSLSMTLRVDGPGSFAYPVLRTRDVDPVHVPLCGAWTGAHGARGLLGLIAARDALLAQGERR